MSPDSLADIVMHPCGTAGHVPFGGHVAKDLPMGRYPRRMSTPSPGSKRQKPARPRRRAPGQVRELLLEAAEEAFARHGYQYTSTKQIADRAGVAEVLLFRHLGSKAELFREAIVEPMIVALGQFAQQWFGYDRPHTPDQPVREFVAVLFDTLSRRRGSALALTAASHYSRDVVEDAAAPLAEVLQAVEQVVVQEAARFGHQGLIPPITARVAVGSVLSAAVFHNWLLGREGVEVPDGRVAGELETLMKHGVRHRPEPGSAARY